MPMSGDQLAQEIKTAYDAVKPEGSADVDLDTIKLLANAIVDHIKNNAKATGSDAPSGDSHNLSIS